LHGEGRGGFRARLDLRGSTWENSDVYDVTPSYGSDIPHGRFIPHGRNGSETAGKIWITVSPGIADVR
jgi:hypothetical protein